MAELTTVLRRGLARRRWWWLGSVTTLGAAASITLGWVMAEPPPDPCAELEQRLHAEAGERAALKPLRARVRAQGSKHVGRAQALLDRTWEDTWARWQDERLDLCEAERRDGGRKTWWCAAPAWRRPTLAWRPW